MAFCFPFKKKKNSRINAEIINVGVAFPGRREVFEVRVTDTVKDLKEKVCVRVGIPVEEQEFLFNQKVLLDKKKIQYYKIQNDRTITIRGDLSKYILMKPADPILQKLNERIKSGAVTGPIKTEHLNQVAQQKKEITQEEKDKKKQEENALLEITVNITVKLQNKVIDSIVVSKNWKSKDLSKLLMKLFVLSSLDKYIFVRDGTPQNERTSLLSNPEAELSTLGIDDEMIFELRSISSTFKVTLPSGTITTMEFDRDANVSELYAAIQALNLENPETLILLKEGEKIPNVGTLSQLGVTTGCFLDLKRTTDEVKKVNVIIKWKDSKGGEFEAPLELSLEEEMWDLMRRIEKLGAGNSQRMRLIDPEGNELDDEGIVQDYGIADGWILFVKTR